MNESSASPNSSAAPPANRRPRSLLPFFFANLTAVYLPGILPTYVLMRDTGEVEKPFDVARLAVVEFLNAPYALLSQVVDGGMFMLAAKLGNVGSFYLFLLGLWVLVLAATILYRDDARRYRLTFILFVIFAGQAIFVARQILLEQQAPQRPAVPELEEEPVLRGAQKPPQP